MRSYVEPYPLCDAILKLLAETQGRRRTESDISGTYKGNTDVRSAIGQLVKDGYVVMDSPAGNWYLLLAAGSAFISDGGYEAEFKRQNEAEELQKRVHQSSISVAASVKRTNWQTVLVAAISAFGTVGTLIVTCNQPKPITSQGSADPTRKAITNPVVTRTDTTPAKVFIDSSKIKAK